MLHYYAKEFFAPVIVTPHVSVANELELYVISDLLTDLKHCSVDMNIYKWSSGSRLYTQNIGDFTIVRNNLVTRKRERVRKECISSNVIDVFSPLIL